MTSELTPANQKKLEDLTDDCGKHFQTIQWLIAEMNKIDGAKNVKERVLKELKKLL